jgi:hypothetical protein
MSWVRFKAILLPKMERMGAINIFDQEQKRILMTNFAWMLDRVVSPPKLFYTPE